MEILFVILSFIGFALWLWLPLELCKELKKNINKDKNYKLFRIRNEITNLKQKLKMLEVELRDYEENTGSRAVAKAEVIQPEECRE